MKRFIIIIVMFLIYLTAYSKIQTYSGTNVRGLIQTFLPYNHSVSPLQFATVDLYTLNKQTQQWSIVSRTSTNRYGYYFFYKITPGQYFVQVNGKKNYQVTVFAIDYSRYQFQDLPILYY